MIVRYGAVNLYFQLLNGTGHPYAKLVALYALSSKPLFV